MNKLALLNVPTGNAEITALLQNSIKNPIKELEFNVGDAEKYDLSYYYSYLYINAANLEKIKIRKFNVTLAELQEIVNNFLTGKELHFVECTIPGLTQNAVFNNVDPTNLEKLVFEKCISSAADKLTDAEKGFINAGIAGAAQLNSKTGGSAQFIDA